MSLSETPFAPDANRCSTKRFPCGKWDGKALRPKMRGPEIAGKGGMQLGALLGDSEILKTRPEMRLSALTIKCLQIGHEGLDLTRFKVELGMWSLGQGSLQV